MRRTCVVAAVAAASIMEVCVSVSVGVDVGRGISLADTQNFQCRTFNACVLLCHPVLFFLQISFWYSSREGRAETSLIPEPSQTRSRSRWMLSEPICLVCADFGLLARTHDAVCQTRAGGERARCLRPPAGPAHV
jgi:hypothetical protein